MDRNERDIRVLATMRTVLVSYQLMLNTMSFENMDPVQESLYNTLDTYLFNAEEIANELIDALNAEKDS